jgi:hypothetical protein
VLHPEGGRADYLRVLLTDTLARLAPSQADRGLPITASVLRPALPPLRAAEGPARARLRPPVLHPEGGRADTLRVLPTDTLARLAPQADRGMLITASEFMASALENGQTRVHALPAYTLALHQPALRRGFLHTGPMRVPAGPRPASLHDRAAGRAPSGRSQVRLYCCCEHCCCSSPPGRPSRPAPGVVLCTGPSASDQRCPGLGAQ